MQASARTRPSRREPRPTPKAERRRRLLASNLTELAIEFRTDKWGVHKYTPHYERHLQHLRASPSRCSSSGIGGYKKRRKSGASMKMWRWFFPRARIVGLDIEDKTWLTRGHIHTYLGDQTDPEILQRIIEEQGAPLVVIDDGSHIPAHVRESFRILFPLLPDGAIYCIEDTQTSYWPAWGGQLDPRAPGTSMDLVKDLDRRPQPRGVPRRGLRADLHRPVGPGRALLPQPRDHREGRQPRGHQPRQRRARALRRLRAARLDGSDDA